MHLNMFQPAGSGHLPTAWRHPLSDPAHAEDLDTLVRNAQIAESACFDSVFLADSNFLWPHTFAYDETRSQLDAMVLLAVLAARTERIGFITTINTSFGQPYDLARKLATMDRLSGGRVAYNVVTGNSDGEARNYGMTALTDPNARYARAAEFVEVMKKLWDSWDDDALVFDKESGLYADPSRVRAINHRGEQFVCEGPLNVASTPQRHPVLVQAGQSEAGRDYAARYAEVIFNAQRDRNEALAFARDIRQRAEQAGRDPYEIKILPGIIPIIGDTEAEARQLDKELRATVTPELGLAAIRTFVGIDLAGYSLDDRVPSDPEVLASLAVDAENRTLVASRAQLVLRNALRDGATVREFMQEIGRRGHICPVGTGEQVASVMMEWFESGACDGFNVAPVLMPHTLEQFVTEVVPVLREHELVPSEYEGTTLRDRLGLERPSRSSGEVLPVT